MIPALRVGLVVIAIAGVAAADAPAPKPSPPDPAAQRAADANLESTARRRGFTFGASVGASLTFGSDVGTGGSLSLKLGQVATPSTVIMFELNGSAVLHSVASVENGMTVKRTVPSPNTSFLAGVQYWIAPSLYVRLMGGVGLYRCVECGDLLASGKARTDRYAGLAGGGGVGRELVRFKGTVLALELFSINLISRDGLLSNNGFAFSLAFD